MQARRDVYEDRAADPWPARLGATVALELPLVLPGAVSGGGQRRAAARHALRTHDHRPSTVPCGATRGFAVGENTYLS